MGEGAAERLSLSGVTYCDPGEKAARSPFAAQHLHGPSIVSEGWLGRAFSFSVVPGFRRVCVVLQLTCCYVLGRFREDDFFKVAFYAFGVLRNTVLGLKPGFSGPL